MPWNEYNGNLEALWRMLVAAQLPFILHVFAKNDLAAFRMVACPPLGMDGRSQPVPQNIFHDLTHGKWLNLHSSLC